MSLASEPVLYRITGMDCASCAAKIENAARKIPGVADVKVSIALQLMTVRPGDGPLRLSELEQAVTALGYQVSRVRERSGADDDDDLPHDLTHITPAYRRALWIVVALNLGYGVVEMVGGIIAGSQALKADALDFLGDGSISFIGLLAIGWSLAWRARSAMIQGWFLAGLAAAVVANTAYRVFVLQTPEAELMGWLAAAALAVNVAAALVLIPPRHGDSNVKAVWLFSRNDAIGNAAVLVAAGLVAWLGSPWPDLIVAFVVAALFLQSAWSIIAQARSDLRGARHESPA